MAKVLLAALFICSLRLLLLPSPLIRRPLHFSHKWKSRESHNRLCVYTFLGLCCLDSASSLYFLSLKCNKEFSPRETKCFFAFINNTRRQAVELVDRELEILVYKQLQNLKLGEDGEVTNCCVGEEVKSKKKNILNYFSFRLFVIFSADALFAKETRKSSNYIMGRSINTSWKKTEPFLLGLLVLVAVAAR